MTFRKAYTTIKTSCTVKDDAFTRKGSVIETNTKIMADFRTQRKVAMTPARNGKYLFYKSKRGFFLNILPELVLLSQ